MPNPRHDAAAVAFLSDADHTAVALLRSGGVLRLPSELRADRIRDLQRVNELRCPVESCRAPELNAALGAIRRHHFRHRPGTATKTGHSTETAFHEAAKHLLRMWAEQQGADARVEGEVADGRRRADMLATLATADGACDIAFEVQYAPLSLAGANGWPERHGDYNRAGVPDVWLFGHTGPQMNTGRPDPDGRIDVALNAEQRTLAAAGLPLRWINPNEEAIATALVYGPDPDTAPAGWWQRSSDYGPRMPRHGDTSVVLRLDPLDTCRLTADGMQTPADLWLQDQRLQVEAAAQTARKAYELVQADQQRRRDEAARHRDAAPTAKDEPADPEPARHRPSAHQTSQRPVGPPTRLWHEQPPPSWDGHPHRHALERLGGVPLFIEQRLPTDNGVLADHRLWHATVYARLVHGRVASAFNAGQVVEALFQDRYPHRHAGELHQASTAYLNVLVTAGLLTPLKGNNYGVLTDLTGEIASTSGSWTTVTARDGVVLIG